MDTIENIKFLDNPSSYIPNSVSKYVVHITQAKDKKELLEQLNLKLSLPDYFGNNWDALSDCLRDFSWIDHRDIFLIHDELPIINKEDLKIYLKILKRAALDWQIDKKRYFEVVFSELDRTYFDINQ